VLVSVAASCRVLICSIRWNLRGLYQSDYSINLSKYYVLSLCHSKIMPVCYCALWVPGCKCSCWYLGLKSSSDLKVMNRECVEI